MAGGTPAWPGLDRDGGGVYLIEVQGEVEPHWERELNMRLTIRQTEYGPVSVLTGALADQSALLGVLGRLAMWGYLILLVRFAPDLAY